MESRCENCIIRQFNSLRALSKEELKKVSIAKISKKIKKGDALFSEGQKLDGVYCVRNGVSKLSKLSSNGKEQIVKLTNRGEIMGQRSVIAEDYTNLSATAINDMEVCFIPKEIITTTLNTNPYFSLEVLRHMAHDLKEADDVIVNMSQKTVKQRLAEALLYLRQNYGEDENGFLLLTLSRDDYANIVGAATESLIRMLSDFKKKGLIKTEGKKIGIVNDCALKELIDGF
ncbi:cAMP-binding domain of CRP or a regulatory subunit of cAMP-dependent protein kinases [Maribacter dokdonensis]|uniref:cAMP-binding domain of CRP or a regulatory subunit of cAMP-dependent protein kinases n=1 Tax=Maribacter dokdonensis TaxID=320912 RepID=A0ABY0U6Q4_9FLAO|nr:Crp/Fnr family transcriptional regulator [Maribacter dokdonensis]SDS16154.1 cAMP-binding domain of CRP or a regulatory subunit of cAMP-dependent protein kinases [Maribacter dokdonensis]